MHAPNLLSTVRRRLGVTAAVLATLPVGAWGQMSTPPPAPYGPEERPDEANVLWAPAAPVNFARANRPESGPVDRVVIHDVEGPADFAVRWFQNPKSQVSAHYVIGEDGQIWQQVRERDVAWHAGNRDTNGRAIGIEHAGFAYRPGFFNRDQYEASARLVRDITTRYGIPRDRTHIIAHAEVPDPSDPHRFGGRGGHTDPGPYWDWDYYMALIRNDARLSQLQAPTTVHPGEKLPVHVVLVNAGDDAWPLYHGEERAPEVRARGPVYLGAQTGEPEPSRVRSPLYDATWVSPRVVSAPEGSGDVGPGTPATFSFTVQGPRELGPGREQFRLVKFPTAPRQPVPFGPVLPLAFQVEPWSLELDAGASGFSAPGWHSEERDGRTLFTRRWDRKPVPEPARWSAPLPIDGEWEIEARTSPAAARSRRAVYEIAAADGARRVVVDQRRRGPEWRSLGRFRFDGIHPVAAVTLSGDSDHPGTVQADAIRLVGPFPGGAGGMGGTK